MTKTQKRATKMKCVGGMPVVLLTKKKVLIIQFETIWLKSILRFTKS